MTDKEKRPTEEGDKRNDFDKGADIGAGGLYLALDDSQKVKVEGMEDDVKAMWNYLYAQHILKRPATRFNTLDALLNIRKTPDETLQSVITRVESALQEIKNLQQKDMKIEDLYADLASMALIRSLPSSEYDAFISTVVLLENFNYDKVKEAFTLEEHNRQARKNDNRAVSALANATTHQEAF